MVFMCLLLSRWTATSDNLGSSWFILGGLNYSLGVSGLITLTTGKNASTASHFSWLWVRLVSEEKQLSLRWGLLMQMSVCVLGERKGICYCPQVMCYSETPRSLLRTEFTLIWRITSLSSKSRAFPQHPSG